MQTCRKGVEVKPIVGIARSLSDQVCTLRISTATPVNGLARGSYQTVTPHSYQETAIEMQYIYHVWLGNGWNVGKIFAVAPQGVSCDA